MFPTPEIHSNKIEHFLWNTELDTQFLISFCNLYVDSFPILCSKSAAAVMQADVVSRQNCQNVIRHHLGLPG